jgi:hypothetical protein
VSHAGAMDSEVPDPEVPERATRPRSYSAQYTPEILAGHETLDRQGKGTFLHREGCTPSLEGRVNGFMQLANTRGAGHRAGLVDERRLLGPYLRWPVRRLDPAP